MKSIKTGLTFADLLLVPAYSNVLPRNTDIQTFLTRNIVLNIPFLSAAMDTVTEYKMAIALAQMGGIGFIHKNMSIEQQAEQVRKVKRSESGLIVDPITLTPEKTVGEAKQLMKENSIGGIPIVNDKNILVGILTNRDLRFLTNNNQEIKDVMKKDNLITAPEGTDLKSAEKILQQHTVEKLPVVNKEGVLVGLITYKDMQKVTKFPHASKDVKGRLRTGAAVGVTDDTLERVNALVKTGVDVIVIDTAHGHSQGVITTLREIKLDFPNLDIIAGNVATGDAAIMLAEAGADAVKVGIGPGSICTTRIIAGVGVPQITAIMDVAEALAGYKDRKVSIIADGGIKHTGDVPKAIAAGADCVMGGSMYAGTDEAPGETVIFEGRKFKSYRGMGSIEAMQKGSKDRYFQDVEDDIKKLVPEGIVGRVPYRGTVAEVLVQYIGGLKAGMGYCGAENIDKLKQAEFIQITQAGLIESHPHDITITSEAPNYSR